MNHEQQNSKNALARIQYQCRRGMLELDVFLMPFCEHCYVELPNEKQKIFVQLLTEADPDLFNWLMEHSTAKPPYQEIIQEIISFQLSGDSP
jgi:antitoxin CptB